MNQRKIGAIISYISIFISTAISLIYTPYMLRTLGKSEHGLFSLVNSVVAYFTIMDFGFGNAIIRYSAKYIEKKDKESEGKLLGTFLFIYSILGAIILILGVVLALNVNSVFSQKFTLEELKTTRILILIGTTNIALSFPFRIFNASIQAHQRFIFSKLFTLFKHVFNPIIMVIILVLGYKSIAMMIGALAITTVFSLVEIIYFYSKIKVKIIFTFKNFFVLKEIVTYSFWIFLNLIVDKISWSTDQLLLGIMSGTAAVSLYTVGANINSYYMTFSTAISGVFLPETTRMVERKVEDKEFSNIFIKVGRIQYIILALILSGFIIYGKSFISLWAGNNYSDAYYVALILIAPATVPLIQNLGITILQAKNIHKFRSVVYLGIAISNILISIPLIKLYGPIGATIGTAVCLIIGNIIVMNIYYQRRVHLDMVNFWNNILKISIGIIIPVALGLVLKNYIVINTWIDLLINIVIYVLIYSINMWLIGMNKYEKNLIIKPLKKVLRLN